MPIAGGTPLQLTHIESPALYASVSPDGNWIASYSGNGLFVMKPDGTQLTTLIPDLGGQRGHGRLVAMNAAVELRPEYLSRILRCK